MINGIIVEIQRSCSKMESWHLQTS